MKPADEITIKLIKLVKEHNCLWNIKSDDYRFFRNLGKKDEVWDGIAEKLNGDPTEVRSRWRSLRDNFRKELIRMRKAEKPASTWAYFPYLLFLRVTMPSDLTQGIHDVEYYEELYGLKIAEENTTTFSIEYLAPTTMHAVTMKESHEDIEELDVEMGEMYEVEELHSPEEASNAAQSYGSVVETSNDASEHATDELDEESDCSFLLCLSPLLESIPQSKKLQIRIRLLQVLMSELLDYSNVADKSPQPYESENFDSLFSLSLIPFMAVVQSHRKSVVRSKMIEILKEELEELNEKANTTKVELVYEEI